MKRVRDSAILFGFAVAALALPACPASLDDRCAAGACLPLTPGDGAVSPEAGNDAAPTDACIENPSDPKCLKEDEAFFVSDATGDDSAGLGTKDKPFKKLGTVLGKITEQKKRIYVCEGTYPEDVVLEAKHAGVSVFGGFTCDWATSPNKPKFGASAMALKINGATGVAIADVAFEAKDAITAGGSSIAAFVVNSDVVFKQVSLSAGKGAKGDNGVLTPFDFPPASSLNGKNGDSPGNGAATAYTCPGDNMVSTVGGKGGESGVDGDDGTVGPSNKGTVALCTSGTHGRKGVDGTSPPAASGATATGILGPDGWNPAAGTDGLKGGAGQGGGGGAGLGGAGFRGGGGGAGGCGGAGGGAGKGGGASIALASVQSNVRMDASALTANAAGDGGDGAGGQPGQTPGGFGGTKSSGSPSCNGGDGGPGGKGAAGGGGAGGISVGVLYKGPEPTRDGATDSNIKPGLKGSRGTGPGNPGVDGVSAAVLKLE